MSQDTLDPESDVIGETPSTADAEAAASAMVEAMNPGLVLLYGSVYLGTATPQSDIDLCVVFDTPTHHTPEAVSEIASPACGFTVDARVTDRGAWEVLSQCVSTFDRYVKDHSAVLYDRPPPAGWTPAVPAHASDVAFCDLAIGSMTAHLAAAAGRLQRGDDAALCAAATEAMIMALVALNHAQPRPHPQCARSVAHLAELVAGGDPVHAPITAALDGCEPEQLATLISVGGLPTPQAVTDLVHTTVQVCGLCVDRVHQLTGRRRCQRRARRQIEALTRHQAAHQQRSCPQRG